jgi:hypothetical protein
VCLLNNLVVDGDFVPYVGLVLAGFAIKTNNDDIHFNLRIISAIDSSNTSRAKGSPAAEGQESPTTNSRGQHPGLGGIYFSQYFF